MSTADTYREKKMSDLMKSRTLVHFWAPLMINNKIPQYVIDYLK